MLWVRPSQHPKVLPLYKLSPLLQQPMHSLGAPLLEAPHELAFKAIFERLHSICFLCGVQASIAVLIEVFSNHEVPTSYITISIQIESWIG